MSGTTDEPDGRWVSMCCEAEVRVEDDWAVICTECGESWDVAVWIDEPDPSASAGGR